MTYRQRVACSERGSRCLSHTSGGDLQSQRRHRLGNLCIAHADAQMPLVNAIFGDMTTGSARWERLTANDAVANDLTKELRVLRVSESLTTYKGGQKQLYLRFHLSHHLEEKAARQTLQFLSTGFLRRRQFVLIQFSCLCFVNVLGVVLGVVARTFCSLWQVASSSCSSKVDGGGTTLPLCVPPTFSRSSYSIAIGSSRPLSS